MTQTSNGSAQSTVVDQVLEVVTRGQKAMTDATTGAAQMWGAALSGADDATKRAAGGSFPTALPSAGEFVDRWVDTGVAVLEMQRSVAHQVLDALRLR